MKNNKAFFVDKIFSLICFIVIVSLVANLSVLYFLIKARDVKTKQKAEEVVILEIWDVGSFEAGNYSKSVFLDKVAKMFYKINSSVCFVVKSVNEEYVLEKFNEGVYPDIISYPLNVWDYIKNKTANMSNELSKNNIKTLKNNENICGVSWCGGSYFLFSTEERLENLDCDKTQIKEKCLNLGYEKKLKKRTIKVESLAFGNMKYYNPVRALGDDKNMLSEISCFEAYQKFLLNEATVLLGTQRDFVRLSTKKEFSLVYEMLTEFNDLFQFISVIADDAIKSLLCDNFLNFLFSNVVQKKYKDWGMFSSIKFCNYEDDLWNELQNKFNGV